VFLNNIQYTSKYICNSLYLLRHYHANIISTFVNRKTTLNFFSSATC